MLLKKEMGKAEIEKELTGKGDYVQIDTLRRYLKENVPVDMRKFASLKLAEIYERRSMFAEAAFLYSFMVENALNYQERMNYLLKEVEDFIRVGFFDRADSVMSKILAEVKPMEKSKFLTSIKNFYIIQGMTYEKEKRRSKAVEVYEKLAGMKGLLDTEKEGIDRKLAQLYKELGLTEKYLQITGKE
jgi:lipopolysaccharide biosynthesis regulator YciM